MKKTGFGRFFVPVDQHGSVANELLWRGSLLPFGCAAVVKSANEFCQMQ
ncbi:hypothetical protein HK44_028845 [Pseudomonas fluorescens HK44]|uniref:Uncharacterized protein n=1 Tax=Pseudomonas fluorescens HK44 TaxID=1042209 RepID=A0A010RRD3_PSEFL|nr:hypothetical protein HK44_028845 [Pseudomonas fluorescens HK44]